MPDGTKRVQTQPCRVHRPGDVRRGIYPSKLPCRAKKFLLPFSPLGRLAWPSARSPQPAPENPKAMKPESEVQQTLKTSETSAREPFEKCHSNDDAPFYVDLPTLGRLVESHLVKSCILLMSESALFCGSSDMV